MEACGCFKLETSWDLEKRPGSTDFWMGSCNEAQDYLHLDPQQKWRFDILKPYVFTVMRKSFIVWYL